ncbi:hypothetical protein [Burkholderia cepacia]|nr:hypothetical protein [Burkholderia cepacia]
MTQIKLAGRATPNLIARRGTTFSRIADDAAAHREPIVTNPFLDR